MHIGVARYLRTGELDASFGVGGVSSTEFAGSPRAFTAAVSVDAMNRITVASGRDAMLAVRYLENGDLDTTFGDGGRVISAFVPTGVINCTAIDLRPQVGVLAASAKSSLGPGAHRIVAAGSVEPAALSPRSIAVARYTLAGDLDSTFGGGLVTTPFPEGKSVANGVCVDVHGGVVIAGGLTIAGGIVAADGIAIAETRFIGARYRSDGSLDSTFGQNGKVEAPFGRPSEAFAVAFAGNGSVVSAGSLNPNSPQFSGGGHAVARYRADGSMDTGFGGLGQTGTFVRTFEDGNAANGARAVGVDSLGRVVAAGDVGDQCGVHRLTKDGKVDFSFGGQGVLQFEFEFGASAVHAMAIDVDDSITVVGRAANQFGVGRIGANGTLGQQVRTEIVPGQFSEAWAVVRDRQKRLIVAGVVYQPE